MSTLISSGCATAPPPATADACAWDAVIVPDAGFEARWTDNEKRQVDKHDKDIEANCQAAAPTK